MLLSTGTGTDDRKESFPYGKYDAYTGTWTGGKFQLSECPDCGKKIALFGESNIDEVAAKEGTRVLGKLPLDPAYAKAADAGAFYEMENPYLDAAVDALKTI